MGTPRLGMANLDRIRTLTRAHHSDYRRSETQKLI